MRRRRRILREGRRNENWHEVWKIKRLKKLMDAKAELDGLNIRGSDLYDSALLMWSEEYGRLCDFDIRKKGGKWILTIDYPNRKSDVEYDDLDELYDYEMGLLYVYFPFELLEKLWMMDPMSVVKELEKVEDALDVAGMQADMISAEEYIDHLNLEYGDAWLEASRKARRRTPIYFERNKKHMLELDGEVIDVFEKGSSGDLYTADGESVMAVWSGYIGGFEQETTANSREWAIEQIWETYGDDHGIDAFRLRVKKLNPVYVDHIED